MREVVLAVKFRDRREGIEILARWMAEHVRAAPGWTRFARRAVVVATPLHLVRRFSRGFDQAGELATCFSRQVGLRVVCGALRRKRRTPPQALASPGDRLRAMAGAFGSGPFAARIRGRDVVLVDDVISTGATADQATRTLLAAGARRVWVVTAAT